MLKRQRPSSPIPFLPDTAEENQLPDDLYEPMAKRRRFYAPPCVGTAAQHEQQGEEGDFNSSHISTTPSRIVDGGVKGWQKGPGEYKDANTLLHDLHAEQRHRIIFSSNKSPSTTPSYINDILNPQPSVAKRFDSTPPPVAQWSHDAPSAQVSEFVEAQVVAQRYGETNKLLRTLVLSRRHGSSTT